MTKQSAGLLLYRFANRKLEVLLVHPGGPFWKSKDLGVWSVPKGEFGNDEKALNAAIRETEEELGVKVTGNFQALAPVKLKSGKVITAFAVEHDFDPTTLISNHCDVEWPPRSGKKISIPEVDRAEWFSADEAKKKINPSQIPLIAELEAFYSLG